MNYLCRSRHIRIVHLRLKYTSFSKIREVNVLGRSHHDTQQSLYSQILTFTH